jgi:hypothetical protein
VRLAHQRGIVPVRGDQQAETTARHVLDQLARLGGVVRLLGVNK